MTTGVKIILVRGLTLLLLALILFLPGCFQAEASGLKYNDVIGFLERDDTYKIPYQATEFVCWDFAERLKLNAQEAEIECAVVILGWSGSEKSHVINAFDTVDKGLVWVDVTGPHTDGVEGFYRIQEPREVGEIYRYEENGGLPPGEYTLTSVSYNWD